MTDSYDAVPYAGYAYSQTHPDNLAALAKLFGMAPAPVEKCRVLELGCGDGANLIPMAYGLPQSKFVGCDLAGTAIAKGNALVRDLGLENIALDRLDVMEIGPGFGQFDYIVAHGLYSWVPAEVREKILAIASANLAPNGVALVSYNAYPGGHLRNMLREMMLFHAGQEDAPGERVGRARALVGMLATSQFDALLKKELARIGDLADGQLYHDDLAPVNSPVYFHEFMAQAARQGLQYLAEADFFEMETAIFGPEVNAALDSMAGEDIVLREQYMDFLKCRRFRQTLLCHGGVELDRSMQPERLEGLYVTSPARASAEEPDVFLGPKGTRLTICHPAAKAILVRLASVWPRSILFQDFDPQALLSLYGANFVGLHAHNPAFVVEPGERPLASDLARRQAADGDVVTNLRHKCIKIEDEMARRLLLLLDGTRDRAALLAEMSVPADQLESNLEKVGRLALLKKGTDAFSYPYPK